MNVAMFGITKTFHLPRVGEHNVNVKDGDEEDIVVERIFKHPSYNKRVINNDIAVLKLSRAAKFGKYVSSACLPQHGASVAEGAHCYITGIKLAKYNMSLKY